MARHAEVTEAEIIQAGKDLEQSGKPANPGSIRTKLGGRGGYPRIRVVWEGYKNNISVEVDADQEISLPTEIEDNLESVSGQLIKQLTKITKSSYAIAQQLAEKRVSLTIEEYKEKINNYIQFELDASESIEQCENQINGLLEQSENQSLQHEAIKEENIKLKAELAFIKGQMTKLEQKEEELEQLKSMHAKLQGKYELLSSQENN